MDTILAIVGVVVGIILVSSGFGVIGWIVLIVAALYLIPSITMRFKRRNNTSSSSSSSSSSSPKRYPHLREPSSDDSSSSLKEPDSNVGYMIVNEINSRLPAVTPSTGLYCDVYGKGTAYLRGGITLWHASDMSRVNSAVTEGFHAAMNKAARQGYDVSQTDLDTSGVSIEAAGE